MKHRTFPPWTIAILLLAAAVPAMGDGPYVLRSVDFLVTGRSLPAILLKKIDPYGKLIGTVLADRARLEALMEDLRQVLLNERAIASVTVEYETAPAARGGREAALHFRVVDTWNLVVLPYPRYSSNTGLDLGLRLRDYNFAGSLQTLSVNLDYLLDAAGQGAFGGHADFRVPLLFLGSAWSAGISQDARIPADGSAPPASVTSLFLSLEIPGPGFPVTFTATQGVSFNSNALDPALAAEPWFLTESLAAAASISLGPFQCAPALSLSMDWRPGTELPFEGRGGVAAALSSTLSWGRVDWRDDLRQGLSVSLDGSCSYGLSDAHFLAGMTLTVAGHTAAFSRIGLAVRLTVLGRFLHASGDDALTGLGSYMRGILDARLAGFQAAFLNLGVPVKLFDFPAHLLLGGNWLDFGLQLQPFLDTGLLPPAGSRTDWFQCSGGLEILVFPAAFRSLVGRAGAGWDLLQAASDGNPAYEIFIGLGLMY